MLPDLYAEGGERAFLALGFDYHVGVPAVETPSSARQSSSVRE
jgi:hypothetical protein